MAIDSSFTEPKSNYNAVYPYNTITQTESGHFFELDDTPGAERVRLQHRTGTFTEIQADGTRINKVLGKNYEILMDGNNVYIKGQCNITVDGPCVINVKKDAVMKVEGNLTQQVLGNVTQSINGSTSITSKGDVDVNTQGDLNIQASAVNMNADLFVRGDISSTQSIKAENNVNAGQKIFATLGFLTPGWLAVGPTAAATGLPIGPLALPGTISADLGVATLGYVAAGYPATSAYMIPGTVSGLLITDLVRSIEADRLIFNLHQHGGIQRGGGVSDGPAFALE
jgi:hypothetical protein